MDNRPSETDSLVEAALKCLLQPDPWLKAEYTREAVKLWREGRMVSHLPSQPVAIPDRPSRSDDKVRVVAPGDVTKRGKGGTLASRCAIIHSLCHIESWAVDLAWDAIARFGCDSSVRDCLPLEFFNDFVGVADDECRHFLLLEQRLKDLGSYYGALPVHDGLWESASKSAGSLAARLAVEHCVHEARGLDVIPSTISKFKAAGDKETAELLEGTIYPEEVGHCAAGVRWLSYLHKYARGRAERTPAMASVREQKEASVREQREASIGSAAAEGSCEDSLAGLALQEPVRTSQPANGHVEGASKEGVRDWEAEARQFHTVQAWFHSLVRANFKGPLKPPFNTEARTKAGFDPEWYLPLAA
mmetsp:Transcript_10466/g.27287  ORF Transcript_10466/g.27287 Transcript_10466/m.27287 type:complete len:360 (+) Transcript_10466:159-1238(+)